MTSVRHRIATADGATLAVRRDGDPAAPVVLLLNSLAADMSMWDPVVARWGGTADVVRVDARGHGGSTLGSAPVTIASLADDALGVLDHLGIATAVVCGLSLGGLIAQWIAIHRPDRLSRLVLANTASTFPPPAMWQERAAQALRDGMAPLLPATLERWLTPTFRQARPDAAQAITAMVTATAPQGYAACAGVLAATDMTRDLGRIACPTLVLVGDFDPSTPPERGADLAAAIPDAVLAHLPAAHLSSIEAGDAFADRVTDWLSRNDQRRED